MWLSGQIQFCIYVCSVSQKKMFFIRQVIAFGLNNGQQIGLDIPLFCKILKIQNILIDFPFSHDVKPVNCLYNWFAESCSATSAIYSSCAPVIVSIQHGMHCATLRIPILPHSMQRFGPRHANSWFYRRKPLAEGHGRFQKYGVKALIFLRCNL